MKSLLLPIPGSWVLYRADVWGVLPSEREQTFADASPVLESAHDDASTSCEQTPIGIDACSVPEEKKKKW